MPPGSAPNAQRRARAAPSDELFAAAVELAGPGSASFKRTARRFSLCAHDAEDAYQRGLEILLTKAPTARRDELRPWLHTVIKHEALALRRQRERSVSGEDDAAGADALPAAGLGPDEAATGRERARRAAEALAALKPSEVRCLVLKALGYSYDEIAARTGFSWTKVNRSLTEGRRRFFERFGEIASGGACSGYLPLLSAACDGHASAEDERRLRTHLAACSGCRAALREFRAAPARLAELLPPAAVLPLLDRASLWSRIGDWLGFTAGERAAAIGVKLQQGAEAASAQKAAAVVASTAAIAGGGAAVHHADRPDRDRATRTEQAGPARRARVPALAAPPARPPVAKPAGGSGATVAGLRATAGRSTPHHAGEFGFEGGGSTTAASTSPARAQVSAASATKVSQERAPAARAAPGGGGGGEFGP